MAFQYQGEIYYKTIQTVQPGQELLVFYGQSYAAELGIQPEAQQRTYNLFGKEIATLNQSEYFPILIR